MALAEPMRRSDLRGIAKPRIAPPTPARSDLASFRDTAEQMGLALMPWQEVAGRYLTAKGRDRRHLYREVCIVVARQNGKTTLAKPLIVRALRAGKKVMHVAQTRELPRHMFGVVADALSREPELFPKRRGKTIWPRYGAGQEEIVLLNGGTYRIAAARTGGARGWSNDLVIIDELLEIDSFDTMSAIEPTLTMSDDPQLVYFSNAGSERSIVLNSVRARRDDDPALAYLEWSAAPERKPDDIRGWVEANPALGIYPSVQLTLEAAYRRHSLAETMGIFETEHLCRWAITTKPSIISAAVWEGARAPLGPPRHAVMGLALDPSSTRASAAISWQNQDRGFGLELVADVTGDPIDLDRFGPDLRALAQRFGVTKVVYDPYDEHLARHFRKATPMNGQNFANACSAFVRLLESDSLHWQNADAIGGDLPWTTKRTVGPGAWMAVKAEDERPITAVLAAIRAVGMAYGPRSNVARIY